MDGALGEKTDTRSDQRTDVVFVDVEVEIAASNDSVSGLSGDICALAPIAS